MIAEQQQRVLQRWPAGTPVLFPRPTGNLNGRRPIAAQTYRKALYRWLDDCDIRDEHGAARPPDPPSVEAHSGNGPDQPGRPAACRAENP